MSAVSKIASIFGNVRTEYSITLPYGVSTDAKTSATHSVTCQGFEKVTGAMIAVKFANGRKRNEVGLSVNINQTGAASIFHKGSILTQNVEAGEVLLLRYDGTNYEVLSRVGDNSTEYFSPFNIKTVTVRTSTVISNMDPFKRRGDYAFTSDDDVNIVSVDAIAPGSTWLILAEKTGTNTFSVFANGDAEISCHVLYYHTRV